MLTSEGQTCSLDTAFTRTIREMNDYNRRLIEEFRAHGGKVGGMWEGTPLLLLTTRAANAARLPWDICPRATA